MYISRPYYEAGIYCQENLFISLFEIQIPLHRRLLKLTRLLNILKPEIYLQNV